MKSTIVLASIALLAGSAGTAALASGHERGHDRDHERVRAEAGSARAERGMHAVSNQAQAGDPSYGWRYFADPAARRAVVISPQGDYYYSRGKGLYWITRAASIA